MPKQLPSPSAVGSQAEEQAEIAILAHRYYEEEGRPEGRSHEHWLRAEQEILANKIALDGKSETPAGNAPKGRRKRP